MTSNVVTESEIIDVLLGQAMPEVEEQVRAAVRSDPEFAAVYDEWARLIPAMKQENVRAKAIIQNACRRLMEHLREQKKPVRRPTLLTEAPQRGAMDAARAGWLARFGWRQTVAALAAAACVVLCAGFLTTMIYRSDESPVKSARHPAIQNGMSTLEEAIAYVDFSYNRAHGSGTLSQPFKTLADGIAAVSGGGIVKIKGAAADTSTPETLRIANPVRSEAVGGNVRIGVAS